MELGWFLVLIYTISVQGQGPDPCTQYTLLDEPRRNVSAPFDRSGDLLCDRLMRPEWYRFKDADIPFGTCITPYKCGTHIGLWLDGTIPAATDGVVSRSSCGTTRADGSGGCCQIKTPMYVKNCGSFLVYYLRPTPGCSMAYCTGEQQTCGQGQYSSTGFRPCMDGYPALTGKPHLSNPIIVGNGYMFTCEVPYPRNNMDATFEVTWLLDGQPITGAPSVTLTGGQRVAKLYSDKLAGKLNKDLTCAVTTSFTDGRAGGMVSQALSSNKYWTGIKLTTDSVDVSETIPTQEVSIMSTVPIVCANPGQTNCNVNFGFSLNTGFLTVEPCEVQLTPTSWNQMTLTAMATFNITTTPSLVPFKETTEVLISVTDNGIGNMCVGLKLPPVQVHQTTSRPSAQCISTGDPHIKTFDQKSKRYNNYLIGQYTMVQRRHSSFRVEARTWKCGRVSCNCAVAMREGNDVITVDMCGGQYGRAVAKLEIKNPAMYTNKTKIVKDPSGNSYMVSFDSGANIKVNVRRGRLLDLYITVPGTFHSDTEGLCGYFDGDIRNELTRKDGSVDAYKSRPDPFILSWRIPTGESLFEKAEPLPLSTITFQQQQCPSNTKPVPTVNLCPACVPVPVIDLVKPTTSPGNIPTPGNTAAPGNTPSSGNTNVPGNTPLPGNTNVPGNTPLPGNTNAPGYTPLPGNTVTPGNTPVPGVSPSTGPDLTPIVSKENATKRCTELFQKYPSTTVCTSGGNSVDYKAVLDMCVEDIQLTDDNEMALSALTALLEHCAHELLITNSTIVNGTINTPNLALTCLGACSGNGVCLGGRCSCDTGFTSSDCSVDTTKPPAITGLVGNICDIATEECFEPIVVGENILNSFESKCYISEVNGTTSRGFASPKEENMLFMSTSNVKCQIQKPSEERAIGQYVISLVNNKAVGTSNEITYLYYNSKCQTCDKQFKCQTKPGTCNIDNVCYLKGDTDLTTNLGTCKPDIDQTSWTPDVTKPSPTPTTTKQVTTNTPTQPSVTTSITKPSPTPTTTKQVTTNTPTQPSVTTSSVTKTTTGSGGNGNSNILTIEPIFNFGDLNYTATSTGCACDFDPSLTDCACCQNFGCPCPEIKRHFCYDCFDPSSCGK